MSACMSGTRGSGVLSSTGDVLVRGVGAVFTLTGVDEMLHFTELHRTRQSSESTFHLGRSNTRETGFLLSFIASTHKRSSSNAFSCSVPHLNVADGPIISYKGFATNANFGI